VTKPNVFTVLAFYVICGFFRFVYRSRHAITTYYYVKYVMFLVVDRMNASIHATITQKQFKRLNEIAETKFRGNFSEALRFRLEDEPKKVGVGQTITISKSKELDI